MLLLYFRQSIRPPKNCLPIEILLVPEILFLLFYLSLLLATLLCLIYFLSFCIVLIYVHDLALLPSYVSTTHLVYILRTTVVSVVRILFLAALAYDTLVSKLYVLSSYVLCDFLSNSLLPFSEYATNFSFSQVLCYADDFPSGHAFIPGFENPGFSAFGS